VCGCVALPQRPSGFKVEAQHFDVTKATVAKHQQQMENSKISLIVSR
jgi:hypothetical protein